MCSISGSAQSREYIEYIKKNESKKEEEQKGIKWLPNKI